MLSSNKHEEKTNNNFCDLVIKAVVNAPISLTTAVGLNTIAGGSSAFIYTMPMSFFTGPASQLAYDIAQYSSTLKHYAYPIGAATTVVITAGTYLLLPSSDPHVITVSELAKLVLTQTVVQVAATHITNNVTEAVKTTAINLARESLAALQKFNFFSRNEIANDEKEAIQPTLRGKKKTH